MEANEIFKVTALVYLNEALLAQEYESCGELVKSAKEFGAVQSEIDEVITMSLRGKKPVGTTGQNRVKLTVRS